VLGGRDNSMVVQAVKCERPRDCLLRPCKNCCRGPSNVNKSCASVPTHFGKRLEARQKNHGITTKFRAGPGLRPQFYPDPDRDFL